MPTLRHSGIRNIFGQLLTKVHPNVGIEPILQPLSGETYHHLGTNTEDGARLDIRAQNVSDKRQRRTYFDVRVFNSHAPSNCMSMKRGGHMRSVSWRWSMGHSHHWCGLQVEAVAHLPQLPSRGLQVSSPRNTETVQQCPQLHEVQTVFQLAELSSGLPPCPKIGISCPGEAN